MKRLSYVAVVLAVAGFLLASQHEKADTVFINGVVYLVEPTGERAEALAVLDGKIAAVGTSEKLQKWIGPDTRVIDLKGRFLMPGFNDAHTHFVGGGLGLLSVNVEGTRSLAEFQQRIRDRLDEFAPGEWVYGRGWDHSLWPENRIPTRADLDAISTVNPLLFTRVDGHSAVVNSLALELGGVTGATESPQGGKIVLGADGEPTGWLKETAIGLVSRNIPEPTRAQRKQGFLLALEIAARNGITSIQDNSVRGGADDDHGWVDFEIMGELRDEEALTVRVTEWLPFSAPLDWLEEKRKVGGTSDSWLKTGALKGVADGSGGSLSAAMLEPFSNSPGNSGLLRSDPETWKKMVQERDAAGFQVTIHAIGDRANRVALDAFQYALEVNRRKNARHRIEHSQFVHPDDIARFADLGVIASAQPCHLLSDLRWAPTILGPDREGEAYPWRSLMDSGAHIAFGTDYSVEPLNPFRGLYAAVARQFEDGSGPEGGWQPGERITIQQAIEAYTLGSAYAEFEEERKGTLTPGKFADLIVLSQDITAVTPPEILSTEVHLTMVGGRVVYEKVQGQEQAPEQGSEADIPEQISPANPTE